MNTEGENLKKSFVPNQMKASEQLGASKQPKTYQIKTGCGLANTFKSSSFS